MVTSSALTDSPGAVRGQGLFTVIGNLEMTFLQANIIITGAKALEPIIMGPDSFKPPSRIELRGAQNDGLDGLFVFCPLLPPYGEQLLVEFPEASLNFPGCTSRPARQILRLLEVPSKMIDAMAEDVLFEPYLLVITLKSNDVNEHEWDWQRLR